MLGLAWQFVTAGRLFPTGGPVALHTAGAIVLHVFTGLTMIAALLHQRAARGPRWPVGLATVVFVLSFVQAYFGTPATMAIHVPGALVLTIGTVVLASWSFTRAAASSPGS